MLNRLLGRESKAERVGADFPTFLPTVLDRVSENNANAVAFVQHGAANQTSNVTYEDLYQVS